MTSAALSLIIPVRRAGAELNQFLASLATQALTTDTECIFVVLGDGEQHGRVVASVGVHGIQAEVIRSSKEDIAIARREGLAMATGRWVTFPNARDGLSRGYVTAVRNAIETSGDTTDAFAVSTVPIDQEPQVGNGLSRVELDETLSGLPSDVSRLVLPGRQVPTEATALGSYADIMLILDLLGPQKPAVLRLVRGARYMRRPMRSTDPQTDAFRALGENYLSFLENLGDRIGGLEPNGASWRHRLAVRELFRLTEFENATTKRATVLSGDLGVRFRDKLRHLLQAFDEDLFARANSPVGFDERRDLLWGLRGRRGASPIAHIVDVDPGAGLMEVRHSRWEATQSESFGFAEKRIAPVHGKRRSLEAFGGRVLDQRIAWVPANGGLRLAVNGRDVTLALPDGQQVPESADAAAIEALQTRHDRLQMQRRERSTASTIDQWRRGIRSARRSWLSKAAAVRVAAHTPGVARQFRDAWLLMDRADMGRDNAEHMYRWLLQNHPEINAWFVLRSDSPDFARLKSEGFRLVEYGSLRHQLLLNNTKQYLSSHVGIDVSRPIFDRYLLRDAPWTFTFLQHGVIHNDLSLWLNRQKLRLFVASTHQEFNGLAGDASPYVFTDREVRLTGLPRFDKLRRIADATPVDKRRTIVIAPTWRNGLFNPPERSGQLRKPKPGFRESPFIQSLLGVLNDEGLRALADRGYTIRFVPHPNLAAHFPYADVPDYVSITTYDSTDVQELIGTAAVFLTDYSSVAFDAAFAGAAVVYMQLDEGAIYGVDHTLFPGYFDFERDGFGPVCRTLDQTLEAVIDATEGNAPALYQERARTTFAHWDTNACQRVYEAVMSNAAQ